jgi:beta-mannosidase
VTRHSTADDVLDLSGEWRAHAGEPDLVKQFSDPATDDDAWVPVRVPHHWRNEPAFATSDGPVLYRRQFTHVAPPPGRRAFLELDGIFYYGDVWLDGEYVGTTEGSFFGHAFDVTAALRARTDHLLAIEVGCPPQRDRGAKRMITGPYWHSSLLDPDLNPGGIWRRVRIVQSGPVRIENARVVCIEASVEQGRVQVDLELNTDEQREVRLHAWVRGPGDALLLESLREATLAGGTNELSWTLTVDDPPRWWPRALGPQHLCTVELAVEVDRERSDGRKFRTAFREVRRIGWQFEVNGEHVFLKGANYGPTRALPGDTTSALVRADVEQAIAANLDFLRVYTHVAADEVYDAADEYGLLLWQDFPMHGGFARGIRKQALRQARAMVDVLGHHPSIFLWSAHDAPLGNETPGQLIASATAPTWGKEVLDRLIARAISRRDGSRPVLQHSGAGDDAQLWYGWLHGTIAGLAAAVRAIPRLGRFVAAFGAQAVPHTAEWMDPERWPNLDWDALTDHHGMQRDAMFEHVPPADAKSFDDWRDATQAYQAALLQLQIEDLRRLRGSPTGGFALFALADPSPAVGFGIVDHERVEKRAYASVRDACRSAIAMVDPRTGKVHVVNDGRRALNNAQIEVTVDGRVRRWQGDIDADAIAFVGQVDLGDAVDVEAVLTHPVLGRVVNRYPLLILEAGRSQR